MDPYLGRVDPRGSEVIQYTAAAAATARELAETAWFEGVDGRLVGLGGVEIALKPLGRSPHNRKLLGEGVGVGFVTSNMNGSFALARDC